MNWLTWLNRQAVYRKRIGVYGIFAGISLVDYISGVQISFAAFYMLPIFLAAWCLSWLEAWGFACLATAVYAYENALALPLSNSTSVGILGWNALVLFLLLLLCAWLFSELRKYQEQMETAARIDFLTRVDNRRSFFALAEEELKRSRRYGHTFSVAFMDLDNFKAINDRLGHPVGDQLLQVVAQTMRSHLRDTDRIGRLGGDEFMILLPEIDPEQSRLVLQRLQQALLQTMQIHDWPVTFSLGVATFLRPPESVETMIGQADQLMYNVKTHGKNRLHQEVFS